MNDQEHKEGAENARSAKEKGDRRLTKNNKKNNPQDRPVDRSKESKETVAIESSSDAGP